MQFKVIWHALTGHQLSLDDYQKAGCFTYIPKVQLIANCNCKRHAYYELLLPIEIVDYYKLKLDFLVGNNKRQLLELYSSLYAEYFYYRDVAIRVDLVAMAFFSMIASYVLIDFVHISGMMWHYAIGIPMIFFFLMVYKIIPGKLTLPINTIESKKMIEENYQSVDIVKSRH